MLLHPPTGMAPDSMSSLLLPTQATCRLVECGPDVGQHALRADDRFIVMATDGLWDVLTDQEAVDTASVCLSSNLPDLRLDALQNLTCAHRWGLHHCGAPATSWPAAVPSMQHS